MRKSIVAKTEMWAEHRELKYAPLFFPFISLMFCFQIAVELFYVLLRHHRYTVNYPNLSSHFKLSCQQSDVIGRMRMMHSNLTSCLSPSWFASRCTNGHLYFELWLPVKMAEILACYTQNKSIRDRPPPPPPTRFFPSDTIAVIHVTVIRFTLHRLMSYFFTSDSYTTDVRQSILVKATPFMSAYSLWLNIV